MSMRSRRGPRAPQGAAAAAAPAEIRPVRDSREALFPRERLVTLADGRTVTVRKWGVGLLNEVARRLPDQLQDLFEAGPDAAQQAVSMLPTASTEVHWIVCRSCGIDPAQDKLDDWLAEDLLDVAIAVVEHCVVPLGEKLRSLGTKLLGMLPQVPTPRIPTSSPTPASDSPASSTT